MSVNRFDIYVILDSAKAEIAKLSEERDDHAHYRDVYARRIDKQSSTIQELQENARQAEHRYKTIADQLRDIHAKGLPPIVLQSEALVSSASDRTIADYRRMTEEYRDEIKQLRMMLAQQLREDMTVIHKSEWDAIQSRLALANGRELELNEWRNRCTLMESKSDGYRTEIDKAKQQAEISQEIIDKLREDLADYKQRCARLMETISELQEAKCEIKERLDRQVDAFKSYVQKIDSLCRQGKI